MQINFLNYVSNMLPLVRKHEYLIIKALLNQVSDISSIYDTISEEIADFSAVVAPMYAQIRINALENARLKGLRDSLLPRLMSGEINVSDIDI